MKNRIEIKRLNMLMPAELFCIVKKTTVDCNCTMTKWILQAIVEKLVREGDLEAKNKDILR